MRLGATGRQAGEAGRDRDHAGHGAAPPADTGHRRRDQAQGASARQAPLPARTRAHAASAVRNILARQSAAG